MSGEPMGYEVGGGRRQRGRGEVEEAAGDELGGYRGARSGRGVGTRLGLERGEMAEEEMEVCGG